MNWESYNCLKITVNVPMKMVDNNAYANSAPNTVHKLGVVVTSIQDSTFYPIDILSLNDMVALEAEVERSGEYNSGDGQGPEPKGVSE